MTLVQEWAEDLGQLNKKDYERVLPLINAVENEEEAVPKLKKIERDFEDLQTEWKQSLVTEDIMNKIWRKIEIIQSLYNTKSGYKKTRWEMFEEIAHEKEWTPIIKIIDEMKEIEGHKDRSLSEETVAKLEAEYKGILQYISTEIGMGYRGMIMREFDKRFRFYNKRMERQVKGDFGTWLKSARKEKGYSLKELESRSGVTASYIHRIEKGARKTPSIPITEKLAVALGVPPKDLLAMLGHDVGDSSNEVPGLSELISLSQFNINGELVEQDEKDLIISIINTMLNEEWEEGDIWTKGSDLLKSVSRLKRQLKAKE
jgi:transcriptional regulator with XRE-family HTH domain